MNTAAAGRSEVLPVTPLSPPSGVVGPRIDPTLTLLSYGVLAASIVSILACIIGLTYRWITRASHDRAHSDDYGIFTGRFLTGALVVCAIASSGVIIE